MKKQKDKYRRPYHSKVSDHFKITNRIAEEMNLDPDEVRAIVRIFFSRHGLLGYLNKKINIKIHNFGTFYFHKKTIEKHQKIQRYNSNIKQFNYMRKTRWAKRPEVIILQKILNNLK